MKRKLLSAILSLTLAFSATQMLVVTANSGEAGDYGVDNNMSEQGGPSTMLPDENDMPDVDDGVDNNMSEQGGPSTMLPDQNEVPEIDYGVDNDMSEQGGDAVGDLEDYGVDKNMSEQGGKPTVVPSTGVALLNPLF